MISIKIKMSDIGVESFSTDSNDSASADTSSKGRTIGKIYKLCEVLDIGIVFFV